MARAFLIIIAFLLVAALPVVGCGGGSSSAGDTSGATAEPAPSAAGTSSASHPPPLWIRGPKTPIRYQAELKLEPSGLAGPEPKPYVPNARRPNRIAMKDLLDGIGTYFSTGEQVTVQYVGYDYGTAKKFASSWGRGRPVTFTLGSGEVIPAWEEALDGMEIGDRRVVVAPPKLARGSYPPNVPAGKTVVFILELLPRSSAKKAEKPGDGQGDGVGVG